MCDLSILNLDFLFSVDPFSEEDTPHPRPAPWYPGWTTSPQGGEAMPTMMRSRPGPPDLLLASTYQYQPTSLLIAADDEALRNCIHQRHGNSTSLREALVDEAVQVEHAG